MEYSDYTIVLCVMYSIHMSPEVAGNLLFVSCLEFVGNSNNGFPVQYSSDLLP